MFKGKILLAAVSISLVSHVAFAELSSKAKKAEKLAAAGKLDEAMSIYKELMSKDGPLAKEGRDGMAALLLAQAKTSFDAGEYSDSKYKAQGILADYKDTSSAADAVKLMVSSQLELSKYLIDAKKYDDCITQSKDIKKKIPAGNEALVANIDKMLSKLSADLLAAGEEGLKMEKYDQSQHLLEFAWAAAVDKADIAKCRLALGKCLRLSDQLDKAIPIYQDVAVNSSGSPIAAEAYAELYLVYQKMGNDSDALINIKQAVSQAPGNSDYLFKEARAYLELGKTEEAKKDAVKVIELLQAEIPKTYINKEILQAKLGQAQLMLGHYTEAGVEFEKALARNPNMYEARKGLALAQINDKNFKSAIDSYDSLIKKLTSDFDEANDSLAKDRMSAEKAKKVEDLRKDIAYFHFQKGLAYEGLGDFDKALSECRAGLEGVSTQEAAVAQKRILAAQAASPKKPEPAAAPTATSATTTGSAAEAESSDSAQ